MSERLSRRFSNDQVVQKWSDLAERRRAHYVDLYQSGRWKLYYSEEQFLLQMREVVRDADAWARIASPGLVRDAAE